MVLNKAKAHLNPARAVKFLGYVFDTSGPQVRLFVPDSKVESITAEALALAADAERGSVQGTRVASLAGKVLATRFAYSPARVMTRELLAALRQLPLDEVTGAARKSHRARDYSGRVSLSAEAVAELKFIAKMRDWNGAEWAELTPTRVLTTDGSSQAYGALLTDQVRGQMPKRAAVDVKWEVHAVVRDPN